MGLARQERPMALIQIIYASRPFGFDSAILSHILMQARRNNARDDITGALICRGDLYLQLIEGPEAEVAALYARIMRDDRHVEVTELLRRPVSDRIFPDWAMRDDPAQSWMWSAEEVDAGAVAKATPEESLAVFVRLAARLREGPAGVLV
jgi:hypothetical protein